jgi:hypothetical protein|tara:strand:+ start:189 stop:1241 length:1053 start_codon:yes stop_codon:yes gene_type:complete
LSCGENEITNEPKEEIQSEENIQAKLEREKEKLKSSILSKLTTTIENGGSTPTIIGYQEFSKPSIGKLMFDGDKLLVNKQYTYYKNNDNYIMGLHDWVTESGELNNLRFTANGDSPEIRAEWKDKKGMTTGKFLIKPILEGPNANQFYYELYSTKWKVYGYNIKIDLSDFKEILSHLYEVCGIKVNQNLEQTTTNESKENSIIVEVEDPKEINYKSHNPCSFSISLPTNFKIREMYDDNSPDYCDFIVSIDDGLEVIELHSMLNSRFEFTKIEELFNVAILNSELQITYKTQKENWFVISGTNKENGNIVYWKRISGENFISDLHIDYPPKRKSEIEPYIGVISSSFISE